MTTQKLAPAHERRLTVLKTVATGKVKPILDKAFAASPGDWDATKAALIADKVPEAQVKKLDLVHTLATVTADNEHVVQAIAALPNTDSMRDLALNYNAATLAAHITPAMIPADTVGSTSAEQVVNYTGAVMNKVFKLEPSAVLQRMATTGDLPIADANIRAGVKTFLANQPEFDISATSVYSAVQNDVAFNGIDDQHRDTVVAQLKTLQRIQAVSPSADAMAKLIDANISSAHQVAEMSETSFMANYGGLLGEEEAKHVYSHSTSLKLRNEHALRNMAEAVNGTGVAMIDGVETAEMRMESFKNLSAKHGVTLSWETLFGSADLCQCGECTSVYSPAAYFVELLQYLRNNDLDINAEDGQAIKSNPNTITGTVLQKFFSRRPDLGCLELTCANTNTILPYIDLVNEVMESFVVHLDKFKIAEKDGKILTSDIIDIWNTEDETTGELLAQPQHTNYHAYCILKNAKYPFQLPYHQPIDAIRIFLDYLGTSRYELMKTFMMSGVADSSGDVINPPANPDPNAAQLISLNDIALARAVDAEFLGLTQEEYIILTKEAFWKKDFFDIKSKGVLTTDDYRAKIGVKDVWVYYGYDSEADMLSDNEAEETGLTFVKHQFLKRTGLLYTDLVDLLTTKYINPNYPQGKALTILDSLKFSYQFLAKLVDKSSTDPKVRFKSLITFLEVFQPIVPWIQALLNPDPCHACLPGYGIDPKDFVQWVYCNFEKIGKLIVLDSGDGPYLPIRGQLYTRGDETSSNTLSNNGKIIANDQVGYGQFGTLSNDGKIMDNDNEQIGYVNENSEVVLSGDAAKFADFGITIKDGPDIIGFIKDGLIFSISAQSSGNDNAAGVLREQDNVTWQAPRDSCDLEKVRLIHLDGTSVEPKEYDKMQRFIRLWRKMGWTIDETDKALTGLGCYKKDSPATIESGSSDADSSFDGFIDNCDCTDTGDCGCGCEDGETFVYNITPDFLHQLVAVKKLQNSTGLELIKLLTFWANISTAGKKSLYSRLFLTHNMIGIDPVFKADQNGNYLTKPAKITDHINVIMAAFNLKANDIAAIMANAGIPDELTIQNISVLYRNRLLMSTLGIKSDELQQVVKLFGDPFTSANVTEKFVELWGNIEDAGFNYRQLNYVVNGLDDIKKPLTPKKKAMLQLAKTLYDGLTQIDKDNADITSDNQATADFVSSKIALLYSPDVATKIMGLLQGTTVYSTNAPVQLVASQADFAALLTDTLAAKLKYDFIGGNILVTGLLTDAETTAAKALFSNADWAAAFDRVKKQALYFYNDVLAAIFPVEQSDAAKAALLKGDTNIPDSQQDPGNPVAATAPPKLAYFIKAFLPYLRNGLENTFLTATLSSQAAINADVTETLISTVLTAGTPALPLIETFRGIKDRQPITSPWTGYLVPAAEDNYNFVITINTGPLNASIKIDGQTVKFIQQDDPDNVWISDTVKLKTGYAYNIEINGLSADLHELTWKTQTSLKGPLPASVLYPDDSTQIVQDAFIQLQKAAILVSGFNLAANEVTYLQNNGSDFGGLDFNNFTLSAWKHTDGFARFRKSLPQTDTDLILFFTWVGQATDAAPLSAKIAALTLWNQADIDKLIANGHFGLGLADFKNAGKLLKLQKALFVADKINADIDTLFDWAKPTSKFWVCHKIAESIRTTTKARYTETDWEQVVQPLNDQLRGHQRDALISYLLVQPDLIKWGVQDADSLFEFFLIDVQMDACMQTSRIKQAINSIQLFVERCFIGLEAPYGVANDILDRGRWEWMQREVLWAANRKVFLYPENWIEESLRDDKSDFFKQLESELLQKDINTQVVEEALKNYLYNLDEVANMRVAGLFIDEENHKLHIFARTRNAPYFFFYRYYDTAQQTWVPWEKLQIDIPSYDVEDNADGSSTKGQVLDNGCYLIPFVYNNRLLIFFPQYIKKIVPPDNNSKISTKTSGTNADLTVNKPQEKWEIKLAWSEYRNNKWTQKIVSKDAVYSLNAGMNVTTINRYLFVPVLRSDLLEIGVFNAEYQHIIGRFNFQGSNLTVDHNLDSKLGVNAYPDNFEYLNNEIYSYQAVQMDADPQSTYYSDYAGTTPYFVDNISSVAISTDTSYQDFYHPYTHQLLGSIETGDLADFFECTPNVPDGGVSTDDMFGAYSSDGHNVYNELAAPYSIYNWELFFHTPMMLAGSLSNAQNFEQAMKWYEYVFNPKAAGNTNQRFWGFWPFAQSNAQDYLENLFNSLQPNTPNNQISMWRDNPFQPHVIARLRPSAYMKWTVMKYLDNLIAWGDYLFRQHTIESINQATQLYIFASHILGERPQAIPQRGKIKPETYISLLDKWDAFGNAMVEMELVFPYSNQITDIAEISNGSVGFANVYGFSTAKYFCIPDNPKLNGYWDTIADRLYKIRHCENIDGVFSLPPLWDPPIDPGLLVQATAQGLSIANILNDMSSPVPNYRFNYLMQKSIELCGELKGLGNALLAAFEKKDGEALASLRARHEVNLQNLVMQVKTMQLDEANKALDGLQQNRKGPVYRLQHYLKLIGEDLNKVPADVDTDFTEIADQIEAPIDESGLKLIAYEKDEMDKASSAQSQQKSIGTVETLGSILNIIPNFSGNIEPFGVGCSISFGGSNLGAAMQAVARGMQVTAGDLTYQSSNSQRKAGFLRQMQDRVLQANNAGYEIKNIDKQIISQQVRIQIADQEITNQQKQIDNAAEIQDFLSNKYSNEDLYAWMRDSVKTLYYQVYKLAYDLAKKAEMVYRFDRGLSSSNFIQFGYWNAGHDGLLAGEQLFLGIKQLEAAYQMDRGYDFEISKHISLRQVNPVALLKLRETGSCEFEIPEILFDMDFPGHYMRRVKSVSMSMPCIVGPYTGVNTTLRLLQNKFRQSPAATSKTDYPETTDQDDSRFMTVNVPITAIAASSGQNDSGVFELNFKDERYMPFEGAGAIGKWRLELPADFKQFDYNTITDVILHMRYTSVDGGDKLKSPAVAALKSYIASVEDLSQQEGLFTVFDIKHDFANEWYMAMQVPVQPGATTRSIPLNNLTDRLPVFTKGNQHIKGVDVMLYTSATLQASVFTLTTGEGDNNFTSGVKVGSYNSFAIHDNELAINNWTLTIADTTTNLNDMWMIIRYTLS